MKNFVSMEGLNINTATAPANSFIVLGCILFVISFLGCYGSFFENQCMLITYSVTLSVIFVLEATIIAVGYTYRHEVGRIAKIARLCLQRIITAFSIAIYNILEIIKTESLIHRIHYLLFATAVGSCICVPAVAH